MKRVIIALLDSVGIGCLPDAELYGDAGANTLGHVAAYNGGLNLPNLQILGLGNIASIAGVTPVLNPLASFGKMAEISPGKDTLTGHWEMSGTPLAKPLPVFPHGFSADIIGELEEKAGVGFLGNKPASGTAIIEELGEEHLATGKPILYTSADSVMQIAAHESVIPVEKLYDICRVARDIMSGDHEVARIIARPFAGAPGGFYRTSGRHDFAIPCPKGNIWDALDNSDIETVSIGKINDIFNGRGIKTHYPAAGNEAVGEQLLGAMQQHREGFIWANFVDFDMLYGHRNDAKGYAEALENFDQKILRQIIANLYNDDLLIITADHGTDPTMPGTDHSREYVPVLLYSKSLKQSCNLGIRNSFADVAATVAFWLNIPFQSCGEIMMKNHS